MITTALVSGGIAWMITGALVEWRAYEKHSINIVKWLKVPEKYFATAVKFYPTWGAVIWPAILYYRIKVAKDLF